MHIISVNSWSIGAILIKLATFSRWNHSAIMFDDHSVFDTTILTGVRRLTVQQFLQKYPNSDFYPITVPDEQASRSFAVAQLGKKYDITAIFGIIFQKRVWQDDNKWFCSEYLEATLMAGGRQRFRTSVSSILPRESYAVI